MFEKGCIPLSISKCPINSPKLSIVKVFAYFTGQILKNHRFSPGSLIAAEVVASCYKDPVYIMMG